MNLPVQTASVSHTRGVVILTMTVVITLMKPNVVSVVVVFLTFECSSCHLQLTATIQCIMHKWFMEVKSCTVEFQFF